MRKRIVRPHARAGVEIRAMAAPSGAVAGFALMRGRELKFIKAPLSLRSGPFALMRGRELK